VRSGRVLLVLVYPSTPAADEARQRASAQKGRHGIA
jgi:hypothetical protein